MSAIALLRQQRGFALYIGCRFLSVIAWQILSVGTGWLVYERTGQHLALGLVGLAQFVPAALLSTFGGVLADRYDRRLVLTACYLVLAPLLCVCAWVGGAEVFNERAYYGLLVLFGVGRAMSAPASQSIVPALVPRERLAQAIPLSSAVAQAASLLGPASAGLLIDRLEVQQKGDGVYAFGVAALFFLASAALLRWVPPVRVASSDGGSARERLGEGARFVFRNPRLLGALSLDLFAVLLGGVTALLPVYAKDVLDSGPWTFGLLRSAPGAGAVCVALLLANVRLRRRAGLWMFASVFGYGLATLVFAYSTWLPLSLLALCFVGATDMVSVVVRTTLIQLWSPDAMRGRISAVNLVFVSSSNELGEFRAGLMAESVGLVRAAALGGVGTCVVVLAWMGLFPSLRKTDSLEQQGTLSA